MDIYKIRILFFTLLLVWVRKRLSQTVPNPKHIHFRKVGKFNIYDFPRHASMHARTHTRKQRTAFTVCSLYITM